MSGAVVVLAAMDEELAPYLERAESLEAPRTLGRAEVRTGRLAGTDVVLVRSGIGLVNAGAAAAAVLATTPAGLVVSTGSAGGTSPRVHVGDVAVGESYAYTGVDATAFGYAPGQVPGMPATFDGAADAVTRVRDLPGVVVGRIVSGDTFVDADRLAPLRERHPDAVATDMESAAVAQVCLSYGVPFVSVRGISDMCGPLAADEHPQTVETVSARACDVVTTLLPG